MTTDIANHLDDILKDVARVRNALNAGEDGEGADSKLTEDQVKTRLSDVSNALDDLYNEIVGI
jgi:hypothetical protein